MRRNDPRLWSTPLQLSVVTLALMTGLSRSYALTDATTECLVGFTGVPDGVKNGGTLEGVSSGGGSCTDNLHALWQRHLRAARLRRQGDHGYVPAPRGAGPEAVSEQRHTEPLRSVQHGRRLRRRTGQLLHHPVRHRGRRRLAVPAGYQDR